MPKSLHNESLSEHVNLCRGQFISSFFWRSGLDSYPFQMSSVICLEAHIQRSAISIVFFKCASLENRPIEFDETFFAEKLKFFSFWNGKTCIWSLKLIMGSPSFPFCTGVPWNSNSFNLGGHEKIEPQIICILWSWELGGWHLLSLFYTR